MDAIAEKVEILPFILAADFNARHQIQAQPGRLLPRFRDSPGRIVVGHGDGRHAGIGALAHQVGRLELAIHTIFRMHMQIKPCFHTCTSLLQTSSLLYYASPAPASHDKSIIRFLNFIVLKSLSLIF